MAKGTVKFFKTDKGFGFIKDDNSSKEIFFHVSGTTETVTQNDVVEYDEEEGKKGPIAVNIKKVLVNA